MALSPQAQDIVTLFAEPPKLGDIKKRAKEIKTDHALAMELWSTGEQSPRLLATLIFDKKQLSQEVIDQLAADLQNLDETERNQLTDWLLANQLMKDKKLTALLQDWQHHASPIMRRLFWYHQARLRWTGQTPPENSAELMDALEQDLAIEEPGVQWAMNFCAAQIGIHQPEFRTRCIALGENMGLYKDEKVPRNCTPNYLPEFIRTEMAKRQ